MAVAHFFEIKVPILFVYYDTPYYAYQDKIISFAVVAYICLFASAARSGEVLFALVAIWVTVLGTLRRQCFRRAADCSLRQVYAALLATDRRHRGLRPVPHHFRAAAAKPVGALRAKHDGAAGIDLP